MQTRGPAGDIEISSDNDSSQLYSGPLVVLTSRLSASASEILAGALQDYGRALIVGDSSTFGKGTVQSILPLAPILKQHGVAEADNAGELKVTIRKFYRPSGASTQLQGVKADIVIPSTSDLNEIRISDERPAAVGHSAERSLRKGGSRRARVGSLRAKSAQRVATGNGFAWIHGEIAFGEQSRATKSVSLNEVERRGEKDQLKARQKMHEHQLSEQSGKAPRAYEITLKDTDTPGLPPPLTQQAPPTKVAAESAEDDASSESDREVIMNEAQHILADYVTWRKKRPPRGNRIGVTARQRIGVRLARHVFFHVPLIGLLMSIEIE